MQLRPLGTRSDGRVGLASGSLDSPDVHQELTPRLSNATPREVEIHYTSRTSKYACAVRDHYEERGFSVELCPMVRRRKQGAGGRRKRPFAAFFLIGPSVTLDDPRWHAAQAVRLARDGVLVHVDVLNFVDELETAASIANRSAFIDLWRVWAFAQEAGGWQENLVVNYVGGLYEILRLAELYGPQVVQSRRRQAGRGRAPRPSTPLDGLAIHHDPGRQPGRGRARRLTFELRTPARLGMLVRAARLWRAVRFSVDDGLLRTVDLETVGYVSGTLPDNVPRTVSIEFSRAMQEFRPEAGSLVREHDGITPENLAKFQRSARSVPRFVDFDRVPNISGVVADVMEALSRHGADALKWEVAPDGHAKSPTARMSVAYNAGGLPKDVRVGLRMELSQLKRLTHMRFRDARGRTDVDLPESSLRRRR